MSREFSDSGLTDSAVDADELRREGKVVDREYDHEIAPPEMCRVLAFPALGRRVSELSWRVEVEGFVYQPGEVRLRKKILLRLLRRYMKVDPAEFTSPMFQERIEPFISGTEKGHCPTFNIGHGEKQAVRRTYRNGRFTGSVEVPDKDMGDTHSKSAGVALKLQVELGDQGQRTAEAPAFLIPEVGVSLVSDIDDTIKVTNVRQRREMLVNTFLKPFTAVQGMASVYRRLADAEIAFHYVSSSPWQLYDSLSEMLEEADFPPGSVHLRNFRLRDHMLRRMFLLHRRGKGGVIRHLLEMYPKRKFLLVGDSGERDPKIYARLARQFPDQVLGILIRLLEGSDEGPLRERFEEHTNVWSKFRLFSTATELESHCNQLLG